MDVNDDGGIEISDPIAGLGFLFVSAPPLPPPWPFDAGFDPTPDAFACGDNTPPVSSFVASPETGQAPLLVTLDATFSTDSDGEIVGYDWDVGDGENGMGETLAHTFTTVGSYTVGLTVQDDGGDTASTSTQVVVTPRAPEVILPESPTQAESVALEGTTGAPIEITYPNMSGLPAGALAFFLSFDHDTSRFEIVASGQVIADGASILSDPGVGFRKAGWGCNCPPYSVASERRRHRR